MSRPIIVGFVMSLDSAIWRGMIRGFRPVAAAKRWMIHVIPPTSRMVVATRGLLPDVLVVTGHSPWRKISKCRRWAGAIIGAELDLSQHGIASVCVNHAAVGRMAAQYLIDGGLEQFAVYGESRHRFSAQRTKAFERAVKEAGCQYYKGGERVAGTYIAPGRVSGLPELLNWLRTLPKPVGIFAGCDTWGRNAAAACGMAGVKVPEDVALVGVDNDELACELTHPPLSSVNIPWKRMGVEIALLAERLLEGKPVPRQPVLIDPTHVVERRSSEMLAVADPEVVAALLAIRNSAHLPLTVPDILRQVPVYRRRLERNFQKHVGHSIMNEVRRVRVDRAKNLLRSTEFSIAQVAERVGFANATKLGIAFRKLVGQTPAAYRRRTSVLR